MAFYEKRGDRIRVKVWNGEGYDTRTFDTKTEAKLWGTTREAEILAGKRGVIPDKTFGDLVEKYRDTLDEVRRRSDRLRCNRIVRDDAIAKVKLRDLTSVQVAEWREARLKKVSAASVRREWNLLSPACNLAVDEWRWLNHNPFSKVKRPAKPAPRDRRPTDEEIKLIIRTAGYVENVALPTQTSRVAAAFLFAIETGMRIGEICALRKEDVFLPTHVKVRAVMVGAGKTTAAKRSVPLSAKAGAILTQLGDEVFDLNAKTADTLWRTKICEKACIEGLHFHDSRHEACTRLAGKLDLLELAEMMGIVDLKTLKEVYYNPKVEDLYARLNA